MLGIGDEIDLIAGQQMLGRIGHEPLAAAHDPDDGDVEIGEQLLQLAQRRVDDGTIIGAAHAQQLYQAVGQGKAVERARRVKAPRNGPPHFDLGRDDHVDGHVVAAEKIRPHGLEIALVAHPRDLGRHFEQRMGDLAGHHVDFIGIGDGDDHIGVARPGGLEHVGVRGESFHGFDIHGIADLFDLLRRLVDDRNVVIFGDQVANNARPHLTGSADYHLHAYRLSPTFRLRRHGRQSRHVPVFSRWTLSLPRPSVLSLR